MKKITIVIIALLSTVLVACGGDGCGEGRHYVLGPPVMIPVSNGKTTMIITTWPYAHCEVNG